MDVSEERRALGDDRSQPAGNFIYSGAEIDQGIESYSALCAKQPSCRARTGNLAASMQHTAKHIPKSWLGLPIRPGNVLTGTFLGLTDSTAVLSPLGGPMTLDSWIAAAHGDPSGFWLLSLLTNMSLPQSFVWGEFASIGMADAQPVDRYFSSGADRGSIIGNPLGTFLWGAGGLAHAWPANPSEYQYTRCPTRAFRRCSSAGHSTSKHRLRTRRRSCCHTYPAGTKSSCPGSGTLKTSGTTNRKPAPSC